MLIIEGPDCVGKTRFAADAVELAKSRGQHLEYVHCGPEFAGSFPYQYLTKYRPYCVCDRFHVSEYVYDRVCRGGDAPLANAFLLERTSTALRAIGSVMVLILPTHSRYEQMLSDSYERGEMYSKDQCRAVRCEFESSRHLYRSHTIVLSDNARFFSASDVSRILDDYLHVQAFMRAGL